MNELDRLLPESKGSGFLERPPKTQAIPPECKKFILCDAVIYDVGRSESGDRIIVPVGFVTDYASIPRILQVIWSPQGRHSGAAIVHDYLYKQQKRSRKACDDIFFEAMVVLGVNKITCVCLYLGVRAGGWWTWYGVGDKIAWNIKKWIN